MHRKLLLYLILAVLLAGCAGRSGATAKVQIGTAKELIADIATTPEEQALGLGGRSKLAKDQGMLFIYDQPQLLQFWMKGMNFPIDLIWIKNDTVVGFEESMSPDNGSKLYPAPEPVDQVLEVSAGWVKEQGVKLGDRIEIER